MKAMTRQEFWRNTYRANRYMKGLIDKDLHDRLKDVMTNLFTLTEKGQLSPVIDLNNPQVMKECEYWTSLFTHILEEHAFRGSGLVPPNPEEILLPALTWPSAPRAAHAVKGIKLNERYLFKYGKHEHIDKALKEGKILIRPASYYNDSLLSTVLKDDELSLTTVKGKHDTVSDYYMYCLTTIYDYRLFDVFEAKSQYNACLIIKEPDIFIERLRTIFQKGNIGWKMQAGKVKYIDPLLPSDSIDVHFSKHFKFAYQKEYRIVWIEESTNGGIAHSPLHDVELELSSLEDICDIIKI